MMSPTGELRVELVSRHLERMTLLGLVLGVCVAVVTLVAVFGWGERLSPVVEVAVIVLPVLFMVIFAASQRAALGKAARPDAPELKAAQQDEWRQQNLARATRVAYLVVLVSQLPMGFLFLHVETQRAVAGMVGLTLSLGTGTVSACYLVFARESRHG